MTKHAAFGRLPVRLSLAVLGGLLLEAAVGGQPPAQAPVAEPAQRPAVLTLQAAVSYALENNPALAAQRQLRGLAAARVVIADTYPFNPILESRGQYADGPASAAIDNRAPIEEFLFLEIELRGQRKIRRQGANAALSRTDWEIAYQEQTLAVQVIRTYI